MLESGRSVGITEWLHAAAEWWVIVLFGLITQLGDVWFLFLVGGVLYVAGGEFPRWGIDRRRGLFVLALVLAYVALVGVLKNIFMLPRPPGAGESIELQWVPWLLSDLFSSTTTAHGPGFPSGHALGTTMVWGGLGLVLSEESYPVRGGVAGVVVVLVSLSRLVLGVHYFVDVVVGVGVGVVALGALYLLTDRGTNPVRALDIALGIGILGVLMGISMDSVMAMGGAIGGWIVWRGVAETTPAHPKSRREVIAGVLVLGSAGVLFAIVYSLSPPIPVSFLGAALSTGGVVAAPILGERLA